MARLFVYLLSLLVVVASVYAAIDLEDDVLVLTEDNFEEAVTTHSSVLVEFYAPWCGHCKSLAPEWASAAGQLKADPFKLAKVDATVHKKLAEKFEIKGFPTIKYFRNGEYHSEYNGGRTASEIITWTKKKSGPVVATVSSVDELTNFQESNNIFVLAVVSSTDSDVAKAFSSVAEKDDKNVYAWTTNSAVKESLGLSGDAVVIFKDFDEKRNDLAVSSETSAEDIKNFVTGYTVPLVFVFSEETSSQIFGSPLNKHYLLFTNTEADHHESTLATFSGVANTLRGQLLFINIPSSESNVMEFFGLKEEDLPVVKIADMSSGEGLKKYSHEGDISESSLLAFANTFLSGGLKPALKTEAYDPSDVAGPVKILKGSSFNDIVLNNDKDVLVEFYAPWCGHCKKLAPVWDELGEKFAGNDNVVIAKMDSTANEIDVPGVSVKGFPTIYFFKGNDKTNPVKYESGRELDDFVAFLKEHATASSHEEL